MRAPGRVNLIGEHTDYNDGFVLPAAIDRFAWAAFAPRGDSRVVVHSENLGESAAFDLADASPAPSRHWSDYPRGVAIALRDEGLRLRGADLLVASDVPPGAGLSSSAALEVAVAHALLGAAGLALEATRVARLCQRAEHESVGTRCGIMDQTIACLGREGHALLLDCRSLATRAVALPAELELVICDSRVKHELAAGEYNRRRAECEAGVRTLAATRPGIATLRDATLADLEAERGRLGDVVFRRCRHVVGENLRVLAAVEALERGDLVGLGRLMAASHASLRDDFEVSCLELDRLVELAVEVDGVVGARMTGGGFGGCIVGMVRAAAVPELRRHVAEGYRRATGIEPEVRVCRAAAGAGPVA